MLRKIYGALLASKWTSTQARLGWGYFRYKLLGGDAYWDVLHVIRDRRCDLFLDIGMHHGIYTDIILKKCPHVRIIGFEPTPETYGFLHEKYLHSPEVKVLNCALGEKNGSSLFFCNDNEQTNSLLEEGADSGVMGDMMHRKRQVDVSVRCLDSVLVELGETASIFAKIDIQGAEALLLAGASIAFEKQIEGCLLEIQLKDMYKGQANFVSILELMGKRGFEIRQIYPPMVVGGVAVQVEVLFVKTSKNI